MTTTKKGVRTVHAQYLAMAPRWQQCRDAAAGEAAIHEAGERYLPRLANETDKAYVARKSRAPFFNATARTIDGLRGMVFRKAAEVELPEGLRTAVENIDGAGRSLTDLAAEVVGEVLLVGRIGLMADYPQAKPGESLTVAQAEERGLRPLIQSYRAESIINWKRKKINNSFVLSLVVLCEEASASDEDEFAHTCEKQYRVLDLFNGHYRQRVFRIDKNDNDEQIGPDIFPLLNGAPMPFIPFQFISAERLTPDVEQPPLIDLVTMNLKHYAVGADYEHGCHFSGLVTMFISGYSPQTDAQGNLKNEIYVGGPTANCLPNPDAKAYFVETQSNFIALRTNLEDKKAQMAVLGARMLEAQQRGIEAADTVAQHRKGEESLLAAAANLVSRGLSVALTWFASWAGVNTPMEYKLNTDFTPGKLGAQELTALVGAWQSGAISGEVLFENLQQGEIIAASTTFEEEQARVANSAPTLITEPPAAA